MPKTESSKHSSRNLPPKPKDFACWYAINPDAPMIDCAKRLPRHASYVASVSWAWSPAHSREDVYHLSTNKHRTHWILWIGVYNDVERPYRWVHLPYAFAPKKGVPPEVAAFYLLWEGWKAEGMIESGPFYSSDGGGVLSADDLDLLAELMWPVRS